MKFTARLVAVVFIFTNVLYAHKPQVSLWEERLAALTPAASVPSPLLPKLDSVSAVRAHPALNKNRRSPILKNVPSSVFSHLTLRTVYRGKSRKTVFIIEDVHLNQEAQSHISRAIKEIGRAAGARPVLVGLEGADGGFYYDDYKRSPYPDVAEAVADLYLKKGLISGPAHAGFTSFPHDGSRGLTFWGVDDPVQYRRNVAAYKNTKELKKRIRQKLDALNRDVEGEKSKTFSKDLLAFDRAVAAYRSGALSLPEFVQSIASSPDMIPLSVQTMLEATEMETKLDLPQVERERRHVLGRLVRTLSKEDTDALVGLSLAYQQGTISFSDYYRRLRILADKSGIDLRRTPAFDDYIRYVLLSDGIDAETLFSDVEALEENVYGRLIQTDAQKRIVEKSRQLHLTRRLIDFSLTPSEWTLYEKGRSLLAGQIDAGPFEEFYRAAEARDGLMVQNHLGALVRNPGFAPLSVLVVGGFHSNGVIKKLKEKGVSYVTASPKLTKIESGTGDQYLSVFDREKSPLERLFAGKKLFLEFVQAGSEKPMLDGAPTYTVPLIADNVRAALHRKRPIEPMKPWAARMIGKKNAGRLLGAFRKKNPAPWLLGASLIAAGALIWFKWAELIDSWELEGERGDDPEPPGKFFTLKMIGFLVGSLAVLAVPAVAEASSAVVSSPFGSLGSAWPFWFKGMAVSLLVGGLIGALIVEKGTLTLGRKRFDALVTYEEENAVPNSPDLMGFKFLIDLYENGGKDSMGWVRFERPMSALSSAIQFRINPETKNQLQGMLRDFFESFGGGTIFRSGGDFGLEPPSRPNEPEAHRLQTITDVLDTIGFVPDKAGKENSIQPHLIPIKPQKTGFLRLGETYVRVEVVENTHRRQQAGFELFMRCHRFETNRFLGDVHIRWNKEGASFLEVIVDDGNDLAAMARILRKAGLVFSITTLQRERHIELDSNLQVNVPFNDAAGFLEAVGFREDDGSGTGTIKPFLPFFAASPALAAAHAFAAGGLLFGGLLVGLIGTSVLGAMWVLHNYAGKKDVPSPTRTGTFNFEGRDLRFETFLVDSGHFLYRPVSETHLRILDNQDGRRIGDIRLDFGSSRVDVVPRRSEDESLIHALAAELKPLTTEIRIDQVATGALTAIFNRLGAAEEPNGTPRREVEERSAGAVPRRATARPSPNLTGLIIFVLVTLGAPAIAEAGEFARDAVDFIGSGFKFTSLWPVLIGLAGSLIGGAGMVAGKERNGEKDDKRFSLTSEQQMEIQSVLPDLADYLAQRTVTWPISGETQKIQNSIAPSVIVVFAVGNTLVGTVAAHLFLEARKYREDVKVIFNGGQGRATPDRVKIRGGSAADVQRDIFLKTLAEEDPTVLKDPQFKRKFSFLDRESHTARDNAVNAGNIIRDKEIDYSAVLLLHSPFLQRRDWATWLKHSGLDRHTIVSWAPFRINFARLTDEQLYAAAKITLDEFERLKTYPDQGFMIPVDLAHFKKGLTTLEGAIEKIESNNSPSLLPDPDDVILKNTEFGNRERHKEFINVSAIREKPIGYKPTYTRERVLVSRETGYTTFPLFEWMRSTRCPAPAPTTRICSWSCIIISQRMITTFSQGMMTISGKSSFRKRCPAQPPRCLRRTAWPSNMSIPKDLIFSTAFYWPADSNFNRKLLLLLNPNDNWNWPGRWSKIPRWGI